VKPSVLPAHSSIAPLISLLLLLGLPASLAALRLIREPTLFEIFLLTGSPQERATAINAFQFFVLSHFLPFF
jgi:hypothetical protein